METYQVKHTVAPHHIHNVDVFSFEEDADGSTYVNFMHLTQGMVTQVYTLEYRSLIEGETREELFASVLLLVLGSLSFPLILDGKMM